MNVARVAAVASKEAREILRDRLRCGLASLLPIMWMVLFGYVMARDVENVPFAIRDEDHTAASRDYAQHFIGSRYFRFEGYLRSDREIDRLLDSGAIRAVIIIPAQFQERLLAGRSTAVQTLLDGTFTQTTRTVRGYIEAIHSDAVGEILVGSLAARLSVPVERARDMLQPIRLEVRYLYNEEVRAIWAFAPALILLILTLVAPLLTALGVVQERETGSIYNIYASTASRAEFLAGKLLPYVLISFVDGILLWAMAAYLFGAPFRGSLPLFLVATLFYAIAACGFGLLLSLLVRTQQSALMITVILSMLIVNQFSGMFTPVASLTGANYVIAHLLPPMYYTDVIQGCFLKGMSVSALGWKVVVLAVQSAVVLLLAHRLFHKRVRQ
jgi:ABC-2 type transport system permease protein/ribosome-dependent ATPase